MKKILAVLLTVVALGCLVGCVNHNDGKCDECKTEGGLLNPVTQNEEGNKELCAQCWLKELENAASEELFGK